VTQQWYQTLFGSIDYVSSIIPGLTVNQNVVDASITKPKLKRDLNIWLQERLLVAGEWKCFPDEDEGVTIPKKELIEKTSKLNSYKNDSKYCK
jgi:hypothetical protein